jgi:hypothetical protein
VAQFKKPPAFVIDFLKSIRSRKTGLASQVKGNISSNALALYLIMDLGFRFGLTAGSDAYSTCKQFAADKASFDVGFN